MVLIARIFLSLALLVQGVGAIASEIRVDAHPHCHASGSPEKPHKAACCHCDECTLPGCASGCFVHGSAFLMPLDFTSMAPLALTEPPARATPRLIPVDPGPPVRPPIA